MPDRSMTYDELFEHHRLRATIQHALIGEITPEIRAISVQGRARSVDLWFYIDGPVNEQLQTDLNAGARDLVLEEYQDAADFEVRFHYVRCDHPAELQCTGTWIYGRKEYRMA